MSQEHGAYDPTAAYDRQHLLFGAKRRSVLDLQEVQSYGTSRYQNPDHVSVYGMPPAEWYARGIRLMGRTTVECTPDPLADALATDVADVAASASWTADPLVVDPFVGSANTLWWILRRLAAGSGRGFEQDEDLSRITRRNLALIAAPIEIVHIDFEAGLAQLTASDERPVIGFLAPPWGHALDPSDGLDLRRTQPPVSEVVDALVGRFPRNPLLLAVQVYEKVDPGSLAEVESRFEWSSLRRYELDLPGRNHGVLIGTRGWTPG